MLIGRASRKSFCTSITSKPSFDDMVSHGEGAARPEVSSKARIAMFIFPRATIHNPYFLGSANLSRISPSCTNPPSTNRISSTVPANGALIECYKTNKTWIRIQLNPGPNAYLHFHGFKNHESSTSLDIIARFCRYFDHAAWHGGDDGPR